jgi:gliding motility-associated-like protein
LLQKKRLALTLYFFLLLCSPTFATHIVGGEMNYKYLGNGDYEITLTLYRDCYNGIPPLDPIAHIGIFDKNNDLVFADGMDLASVDFVPNAINSPCLTPPTDVCYEVGKYYHILNLPPLAGGYQIAYQRCCRNHTIINIPNPGDVGTTITCSIPDAFAVPTDNNPVFKNLPPTFICNQAPFIFDHSATDADGDSLVYELCLPYDGASTSDPMPDVPSAPPYLPITYLSPYSLDNVLGGTPMTINPQTGVIRAVPESEGQFVYGVCVKEYRNGIYIGETRREFQVNVQPCGTVTLAGIFSPTIACGTLTADFLNLSYGAGTYAWSFGDPNSTNDTSSALNPTYTYTDTGTYYVQLIAFSSINVLCNDTDYGVVRVYPEFNSQFEFASEPCSPSFQFSDLSSGVSGNATNWQWYFGDGFSSGMQNPTHDYLFPGFYNVTLIASADSGCSDTISQIINVLPVPNSEFSITLDSCKREITLNNTSTQASTYSWNFGDGGTQPLPNNTYIYSANGTFTIQLIAASDSGCMDMSEITVQIPTVPIPDFNFTYAPCDSVVHFTNLTVNSTNFSWDFGDNTYAYNTSPSHLFEGNGPYTVTLSAAGTGMVCINEIEKVIELERTPSANFAITLDTCDRLIHINNLSSEGNYSWNFGDGGTGVYSNNTYTYSSSGDYIIQLIAQNNSGCSDTAQTSLALPALPILNYSYTYNKCDSVVYFTNLSVNGTNFNWSFGDSSYETAVSPSHLFEGNGPYTVTLYATGNGMTCANDIEQTILLERAPVASFNTNLDTCTYKLSMSNQTQFATGYSWLISDGSFSTSNNFIHDFALPGGYTIQLIALTASGCSDTVASTVNIPPKAKADYSLIHYDCDSVVTFVNNSQNAVSYNWTFGDSKSSTAENPDHIYTTPGNVQIQLIVTSAHQCRDSIAQQLDLIFRIPADFAFSIDSCSEITTFYNLAPKANTYEWNFGDGSSSNEVNPLHVYRSTEKYLVTFITNEGSVCEEKTEQYISFEEREGEVISIPSAFTPNKDGRNDRFKIFGYKPCEVYSLNIFNRWGERVYESNDALNDEWDGAYKGSFVPEGVYVYTLKGKTVNKSGYIVVIK